MSLAKVNLFPRPRLGRPKKYICIIMLDLVAKLEYKIICFIVVQVVVLRSIDSTVIGGSVAPSMAVASGMCTTRS